MRHSSGPWHRDGSPRSAVCDTTLAGKGIYLLVS